MSRRVTGFVTASAAVVALVGLDQFSKLLVKSVISPSQGIKLGLLEIVNIENTGTVFGLFKGSSGYLVALAIVAIAMLLLAYSKLGAFQRSASILMLSGMAGNTIDRLAAGHVTDFIYIRPWPAFNLADALLSAGAVLVVASFVRNKLAKNEKRARKK